MELPASFVHSVSPPKGYSYEVEYFNRNIISIWLRHHTVYDYNLGKSVRTIHSFYNSKTQQFYAPINSKTMGKLVDFKNTSPYSSMQIQRTPLEAAFL